MQNTKQQRAALKESLQASFMLKVSGQVLYSAPEIVDIGVTMNHWVHYRGQQTVYMRMNDISVPSIYGPSADDKNFIAPK